MVTLPKSEVFNEDCMVGMARYPDRFFDLAIVDPPYGIGEDGGSNHSRGTKRAAATKFTPKNWDTSSPDELYFIELRRISKNQIIWGANHFISKIPFDSSCWIVWDKHTTGDQADCELAYTSFPTSVRRFSYVWNGWNQGIQGRCSGPLIEKRIHPTQKPIALYKWLLAKYGNRGGYILDTHMGSQSSRIAAFEMGFDYTGFELDPDYFIAGNKRFAEQTAQAALFNDPDLYTTGPEY